MVAAEGAVGDTGAAGAAGVGVVEQCAAPLGHPIAAEGNAGQHRAAVAAALAVVEQAATGPAVVAAEAQLPQRWAALPPSARAVAQQSAALAIDFRDRPPIDGRPAGGEGQPFEQGETGVALGGGVNAVAVAVIHRAANHHHVVAVDANVLVAWQGGAAVGWRKARHFGDALGVHLVVTADVARQYGVAGVQHALVGLRRVAGVAALDLQRSVNGEVQLRAPRRAGLVHALAQADLVAPAQVGVAVGQRQRLLQRGGLRPAAAVTAAIGRGVEHGGAGARSGCRGQAEGGAHTGHTGHAAELARTRAGASPRPAGELVARGGGCAAGGVLAMRHRIGRAGHRAAAGGAGVGGDGVGGGCKAGLHRAVAHHGRRGVGASHQAAAAGAAHRRAVARLGCDGKAGLGVHRHHLRRGRADAAIGAGRGRDGVALGCLARGLRAAVAAIAFPGPTHTRKAVVAVRACAAQAAIGGRGRQRDHAVGTAAGTIDRGGQCSQREVGAGFLHDRGFVAAIGSVGAGARGLAAAQGEGGGVGSAGRGRQAHRNLVAAFDNGLLHPVAPVHLELGIAIATDARAAPGMASTGAGCQRDGGKICLLACRSAR